MDTSKTPEKVVLQAPSFLGDQVVFTGVVRDLLKAAPGRFLVDVNASHPDLWLHNPHLTKLDRSDRDVRVLSRHYCPGFRDSNPKPMHFLELYARRIGAALRTKMSVTRFGGDIHLSVEEMSAPPHPELADGRYWIVVAGCKKSVPVKGWGTMNYQGVVDALRGRVRFVQLGSASDAHPPLNNALNLVGKTSVRELIRLIYHADGVLCPITSAMHLAAAVPARADGPTLRPCIVIAGGREPVQYIAYPGHHVLHTIGSLPCCAGGGCGKSHFPPKAGGRVCHFPVSLPDGGRIPECMSLVRVQDVVATVELSCQSGTAGLSATIGRVRALLRRLPESPVRGAEVGVFYGRMSAQLLNRHPRLHLIMVDRWAVPPAGSNCAETDPVFYGRPQTQFDGNYSAALQSTEFAAGRRTVIRAESSEAAAQVPGQSLDFVFIDADHSYEGARADILTWVPKLKPGGLLCGHDYHRPNQPREGVKRAVDEYAALTRLKMERDADNTLFIKMPAR